ncbi:MAG: carbohydrate ABC transporter permease [Thermomicrobiales bacterium]
MQTDVAPRVPAFTAGGVSPRRRAVARAILILTTIALVVVLVLQIAYSAGWTDTGFGSWRPVALAVLFWFVAIDVGVVLLRGVRGERALFLLPAVELTFAFVIFPTIFGIYIAFTDWNLSAVSGRHFNGLDNFRRLVHDGDYWRVIGNNFKYLIGVLIQYVIAFGLALLLNQNIRGRKFFRVVFLLPFMLSPVAIGWMIGRSILDAQYGVVTPLLAKIGFEDVSFFDQPFPAFLGIMAMDAWYSIPFIMVLLLAGLQALPHEVFEASRIDGATAWQTFRHMTFPLLLPVSLTAIVLRAVFEFKLIDIVRVVTNGGPGESTDTATNFIYREGIEKTNVGYATALSQVFLIIVILFVAFVLVTIGRKVRDVA